MKTENLQTAPENNLTNSALDREILEKLLQPAWAEHAPIGDTHTATSENNDSARCRRHTTAIKPINPDRRKD